MNDNPSKPTKPALMNSILMQAMTCIVDFAPASANIPEYLRGADTCQLKFDGIRCRDIFVGEDGVRAGMTFNGRHHDVFVPWAAVYCISFDVAGKGPRGVIYQESIPESVVANMLRASREPSSREGAVKSIGTKTAEPKQATVEGEPKFYTYSLDAARARRAAQGGNGPKAG